jgi:SAM-dependent methyltransferase
MKDEVVFINNALKGKDYDVIDLGAGYGRIIPQIIKKAKAIVAIELNENMYSELIKNQKNVEKVSCIRNDITKLSDFLHLKTNNNLFLLCQNTLGVIEGDYLKMFDCLKDLSRKDNIEIIISVFNKDLLHDYGLFLYAHLRDMVGDVDLEKTNFETGKFISKTGYYTKWWSKAEIYDLKNKLNAVIINGLIKKEYSLYHFQILPV